MRLYIGAAVAAVALLILMYGGQSSGVAEQEYQSLIKLSGCAAGCAYEPLNSIQLLFCVVISQPGSKLESLYECGAYENQEQCKVGQSTDKELCFWFARPEPFKHLIPDGGCLPAFLSTIMSQFLLVAPILAPFFAQQPPVKLPRYYQFMQCLKMSGGDDSACTSAKDTSGYGCVVSQAINPTFYPTVPQLRKLCFQFGFISHINELLSMDGVQPKQCPKLLTLCKGCDVKDCSKDCPVDCSADCPVECSRDCPRVCSRDCPPRCYRDCPLDCPALDCPSCPDCGPAIDSQA